MGTRVVKEVYKVDEKIKAILGDRTRISQRTMSKIFTQEEMMHFRENSDHFGYAKCSECNYYVRMDLFNNMNDMCGACHKNIVKE